ncbi:hypothetical protein H9P43_004766 [Blastocladiella emersonii ATCC 22665]|nr:hypothetical protein H9P43_004766 [Blastocladiella emersonii ATCC 22665]
MLPSAFPATSPSALPSPPPPYPPESAPLAFPSPQSAAAAASLTPFPGPLPRPGGAGGLPAALPPAYLPAPAALIGGTARPLPALPLSPTSTTLSTSTTHQPPPPPAPAPMGAMRNSASVSGDRPPPPPPSPGAHSDRSSTTMTAATAATSATLYVAARATSPVPPTQPPPSAVLAELANVPPPAVDLDDATLYPYVLRAALWHDRKRLPAGDSLHGGGAMAALARRLFGVPANKAKDPAYNTVKVKSDDKHLYRDLQHYHARLDADSLVGRAPADFPSPAAYAAWKSAEAAAVHKEVQALAARDPKNARKSKHTPPAKSDPCLFVPPCPDHAFLFVLRRTASAAAAAAGADDGSGAGLPGWPSPEIDGLLELLQTRWRVNRAFRHLAVLDRIVQAQVVRALPPAANASPASAVRRGSVPNALDVPASPTTASGPRRPKPATTSTPHALREVCNQLDIVASHEPHVATWTRAQRALLVRVLTALVQAMADRIQHYPEYYARTHFVAAMEAATRILAAARAILDRQFGTSSMDGTAPLPSLLKRAAYLHFRRLADRIAAASLAPPSPGAAGGALVPATRDDGAVVDRILTLCDVVEREIDTLRTYSRAAAWSTPQHLLASYLLQQLFAHIDEWWLEPRGQQIGKVFELHNAVTRLARASREHQVEAGRLGFDAGLAQADLAQHVLARYQTWFQDAVDDWIQRTSETMAETWTKRMVAEDQFVAQSPGDLHSTSVIDLFSAFHQEVDAIRSLPWPSFDHEYRAIKRFTRTMCTTLITYSNHLQAQLIAILLQMEEAAMAATEAAAAAAHDDGDTASIATSSSSGKSSPSASERSRSLMNRLRASLVGGNSADKKHKDRTVAGKVTRRIRSPVEFTAPMCVRLNNMYQAKKRVDALYHHLSLALSDDPPGDDYVSPFARDETLVAMAAAVVELDPPAIVTALTTTVGRDGTLGGAGPDVFFVEVLHEGVPVGTTRPEEGVHRTRTADPNSAAPTGAPVTIDLDDAVLIPGTTLVTVQLAVRASMLSGESVVVAVRGTGSGSAAAAAPTSEEREGLAKGGMACGTVSATLDVRDLASLPVGRALERVYPVVTSSGASGWAHAHGIGSRRLRLRVHWVRAESRYLYHFFDDAYSTLAVMVDNALLMMANQIGTWMQDYMLQLVKQYKLSALSAAFGVASDSAVDLVDVGASGNGAGSAADVAQTTIFTVKTRSGKKAITFATVETDMQPLLDYLNRTLEVLNNDVDGALTTRLFKRVWRQALASLEWQLTGRREKRSGKWKQVDPAQVAVLRRALTLLYDFFHVDGDGLPRTTLQSRHYHRLAALLTHYHASTDDLIAMYQSALNFYLAAKVEGIHKRAARFRQTHALSRASSLASFSHAEAPATARIVSPDDVSPFASAMDIHAMADPRARAGSNGGTATVRRHLLTHRRPAALRHQRGGKNVSAADFLPRSAAAAAASAAGAHGAGAKKKPRRFQYVANAESADDDESASDADADGPLDADFEEDADDDEEDDAYRRAIDGDVPDDSASLATATLRRRTRTQQAEAAAAQAEFKLASLARQEAIWTVLCLRADAGDHECRDFVTVQAETVGRILENMREEVARGGAAKAQQQAQAQVGSRVLASRRRA